MAEEASNKNSGFVESLANVVPPTNPIGQAINLISGSKQFDKKRTESGQKDLEKFISQSEKSLDEQNKAASVENKRAAEIDSLGQMYLKAQQLATKVGKAPPALPNALKGSQYDPEIAQQMASDPSQYAIPQMGEVMQTGLQAPAGTPQQAQIANTVARDLQSDLSIDRMQENYTKQKEINALAYQTRQAEMKAELDKQLSEIERVRSEHATVKMDPNRFWSTRTTAQKVGFGIASILSGIGAGLQGSQRNMAIEVVQNAINQDIEAQKQDFINAKDALSQKESLYAKYYALYKDDQAAQLATENAALSQFQLQLQAQATKAQNQFTRANAERALLEVEALKADAQSKLQAKLKLSQLKGGASVAPEKNIDTINALLTGEEKKEALKENTELIKYKNLENAANSIFKRFEGTSMVGRALGVGDSDELQAELSGLLTNAGMGSKEVDKIIGSLTPGMKPSDVAQKKASVLNILKQKAPATPLLDSLGIGANRPQVNIPGKTSF